MQNCVGTLDYDDLVFQSQAMFRICHSITKYAKYSSTVLICGESGVGKDLIAYHIHCRSIRKKSPFVIVPISGLSESIIESELFGYERGAFTGANKTKFGKFEVANGGTLYIPEISELPIDIQLKLLNFLQYRFIQRVGHDPRKPHIPVDVLLIMATNADLEKFVSQNKIRRDFYYRININRLFIPPLRERVEDIKPLAEYFVKKTSNRLFNKTVCIDNEVIRCMENYHWPGNVREMQNVIEELLIESEEDFRNSQVITMDIFEKYLKSEGIIGHHQAGSIYGAHGEFFDYKTAERIFKEEYFYRLLEYTSGDIKKAAEISKLTVQGLKRILNRLREQ